VVALEALQVLGLYVERRIRLKHHFAVLTGHVQDLESGNREHVGPAILLFAVVAMGLLLWESRRAARRVPRASVALFAVGIILASFVNSRWLAAEQLKGLRQSADADELEELTVDESAMLRTFGASRNRVLGGVAAEFVAIGLLSGILAAAGATLAGWLLAVRLFDLDYGFSAALWMAGPVLGVLFVGLSGMAATWRVVTHAPVSVLRAA